MENRQILEFLRMILLAFAIALVINLFRVLVFQDFRTNAERNLFSQIEQIFGIDTNNNDNYNDYNTNNNETSNEIVKESDYENNISSDIIDIPIEPMQNFSGMSRDEILNLRKQAVRTSPIFSGINYSPSYQVFAIEDGMPWISANAALYWDSVSKSEIPNGVSRDSIGILNPELLYYVSIREYGEGSVWIPFYKPSLFEPYRVVYKPETKTIIAYIKNERNKNGNYESITLADSNAHDLGYKYAYMDSYDNVGFYNRDNYKNNSLHIDIKEVTGWYMHGPACGLPGGCNNYAPYWQYHNTFYLKDLPATVHIKLWKNCPDTVEQKADINYVMVFE